MQKMQKTAASTCITSSRSRFNHLKTMFYQAPLSGLEFDELIQLAERFSKKMAEYLKSGCLSI